MLAGDLPAPKITGTDPSADFKLLLRDPAAAAPKLYVPKEKQTSGIEVSIKNGGSYSAPRKMCHLDIAILGLIWYTRA